MNDIQKLPHYSYWLVFGLIFLATDSTTVSGAELTDLVMNNSRGDLRLSLKVKSVFTEEVKEAVSDGISFTIVFSMALYQVHNLWFDKQIAQKTVKNTVKYDLLKKDYRVMRSWDSGSSLVVWSLDNVKQLVTEVNNLEVTPLTGLVKGRKYQIRAKAVCDDRNKLFIGPSWCFKTDWYTIDFLH
jgi:hypothetical protein